MTVGDTTATDRLGTEIGVLIREAHASIKQMAGECRTGAGMPRCYVCGRTDGLKCVARGWGGVWVCRGCSGGEPS